MPEYSVVNSGAPYFRWVGGVIKARQGNLAAGVKVNGNVSGKFFVISSGLSGEAPLPYAMYLIDLAPTSSEPSEEPPSEPEIEVDPSDVMIHQVGGIETERFYRKL